MRQKKHKELFANGQKELFEIMKTPEGKSKLGIVFQIVCLHIKESRAAT